MPYGKTLLQQTLGTIQKHPLYPKSIVLKLGYVRTAHQIHRVN